MDCICGYDWDEDNDRSRNTTGTRKREEPRRAPARPISRIPYRHLLRSVFRITYRVHYTRNGLFKMTIRNNGDLIYRDTLDWVLFYIIMFVMMS